MRSYLPDAVPLPEIRRALVTKLRHHGDVLLTAPVFSTLKRLAPQMEIGATLAQWGLHSAAMLSAGVMKMASSSVAAVLLVSAGVFQFSSAKSA